MGPCYTVLLVLLLSLVWVKGQYAGIPIQESESRTWNNFSLHCATAIAPGDVIETQVSPGSEPSNELVAFGEYNVNNSDLTFFILNSDTGEQVEEITNTETSFAPCIHNSSECTMRCLAHIDADGSKLFTVIDSLNLIQFNLSLPGAPAVFVTPWGVGDFIDHPDPFLPPRQQDHRFTLVNHELDIQYATYTDSVVVILRAKPVCTSPCEANDYTLEITKGYVDYFEAPDPSDVLASLEVFYATSGVKPLVVSPMMNDRRVGVYRPDFNFGITFISAVEMTGTRREYTDLLAGIHPKFGGEFVYGEIHGQVKQVATNQMWAYENDYVPYTTLSEGVGETVGLKLRRTRFLRPRVRAMQVVNGVTYVVQLSEEPSSTFTHFSFSLLDSEYNYLHVETVYHDNATLTTSEIVFTAEYTGRYYVSLSVDLNDVFGSLDAFNNISYSGTLQYDQAPLNSIPTNFTNELESSSFCCFFGDISDLRLISTDLGALVVTSGEEGLQIWNPEDESPGLSSFILNPYETNIVDYMFYKDVRGRWRILTYSKGVGGTVGGIDIWFAAQQPEEPTPAPLMNALIPWFTLINVSILMCLARKYSKKKRDPEDGDSSSHDTGASSQVNKGATEDSLKLSTTSKALALIGYKTTPAFFHVTRYDERHGYYVPSFRFRRMSIPKNKVWLVLILLWIGFFFSPTIDRELFSGAFESPTETCEFPEFKHEVIRQGILDELNYDAAADRFRTMAFNFASVSQQLQVLQSDTVFNNFPNESSAGCTAAQEEQYAEVKKSLTAECTAKSACAQKFNRFKTNSFDAIVAVFESDISILVDESEVCVPPRGTKEPCPIDTSVITDLGTLQDLAEKYQALPARDLPITAERTADYIAEEVDYVILLIEIGSDIYIVYAIICIFITTPLRLHASNLLTRIKRRFFTMPQSKFIIILVALFWSVPYIVNLLERLDIWVYFYNSISDVCFTQVGFLSEISQLIIDSCTQVDELEKDHYTTLYQLRDFNASINFYKQCGGGEYNALDTFFEEVDAATLDAGRPFNATICDADYLGDARERFALAPEPEAASFWAIVVALGLVVRTFAKFVFTNFAISFVKVADPLLLHDGKVEAVKNEPIPEYSETVSYLSTSRFPGFMFNVFLVLLYAITLFETTGKELEEADPELSQWLILLLCGGIALLILTAPSRWLAEFALYRKFKNARLQSYNFTKEKLSGAASKTMPVLSSAATKAKEKAGVAATITKEKASIAATKAKEHTGRMAKRGKEKIRAKLRKSPDGDRQLSL